MSKHGIIKFILLLSTDVNLFKLINSWEKFNESSLSEREDFYKYLNMKDITDADYMPSKRVCKDFKT